LRRKGQSILDFILIIGSVLILMVGLIRIWIYFNANIAKRSVDYQNTRLAAGTATSSHFSGVTYTDSPLGIDDNWVFKGIPSGSVGTPLPGSNATINPVTGGGEDGTSAVCTSAQETAASMNDQADAMEEQAEQLEWIADLDGQWWNPLYWVLLLLGIDPGDYADAVEDLEQGAADTRTSAAELVASACGSS